MLIWGPRGSPRRLVANMCFLWSRDNHYSTGQVRQEGKVKFTWESCPQNKLVLDPFCVWLYCGLYGQAGAHLPPWCQPLPLGKGQGLINFQLQSQGWRGGQDGSGRSCSREWSEKIGQSGGKAASQGLVGVNSCGSVNLLPGSLVLTGVSGGHSVHPSASPGSLQLMVSFQVWYIFFQERTCLSPSLRKRKEKTPTFSIYFLSASQVN